jgi:hypothetical protein
MCLQRHSVNNSIELNLYKKWWLKFLCNLFFSFILITQYKIGNENRREENNFSLLCSRKTYSKLFEFQHLKFTKIYRILYLVNQIQMLKKQKRAI